MSLAEINAAGFAPAFHDPVTEVVHCYCPEHVALPSRSVFCGYMTGYRWPVARIEGLCSRA